ncbi:hypothetical protein [Agrococcus sp. ARC_14]|uniref:hypothetical protein n=1 Tax=Agrococcus sp. ARC_14 TaxID=2919927 RepID=UPI001F05D373|nr:hypothetical protein [Agrococcus sp. ARC_14]MCH1883262.1 hypothetical protein [Agrococcus sp. ARC_14]
MPFLAGTHRHGRWADIAAAGRSLRHELERVTEPAWVQARVDPWAAADRIAWEEDGLPRGAPRWLQALAGRRARPDGTRTLIHGDLTGNVLLEPCQPPAIIDLSPYFRPVEYATAILVVDAVCFEKASPHTARLVTDEDAHQLLLRAILFRAATDLLRDHTVAQARYGPAIALLDVAR